jgi:hypothetical protein
MNIPNMPHPPGGDKHTPSTDLRAMDQFMKEEYDTTTVDLKSKVPDEVKVVVLCNAEGLTETQKFWTDQFLMRGGGLIVMADGSQIQSFGGMPGGQQNPFMRSANDKLPDDFFSHYGFTINKDVVLDLQCAAIRWQGQGLRYPPFIVATVNGIDQTHPISANFRNLIFTFASSVSFAPKPGVKAIDMVKSSDTAKHVENFMMLSPDQILPDSEEKAEAMKKEYKSRYVLAGLLEGDFQSYFVAHPVPKDVVEGKPAPAAGPGVDDPFGGLDHGSIPLPPGDEKDAAHDDGDAAKAKSKPSDGDDKANDGGKPEGGKPDGGPHVDDLDVAGGGIVAAQNAPPAPAPAPVPVQDGAADGKKAPDAKAQDDKAGAKKPDDKGAAPAEKKPFEFMHQSIAPGRILVIGTTEFAADGTLRGGSIENAILVQNAAGYMASDDLSTVRAKRLEDRPFDKPTETAKNLAIFFGGFFSPLLLVALLVIVYVWRRIWRPAASRRRMAAAAAH